MINEPPAHLRDRYHLYAIWLEDDYGNRPSQRLLKVHIGRPVSFRTLINDFIGDVLELTVEKTGEKINCNLITGVHKIPNQDTPDYELCVGGLLKDIV